MKKFNEQPNLAGSFIQDARKRKGLTKIDLCRELELHGIAMSRNEIYRIEHNQMIIKDFELIAFCIVLDIPFQDLINCFEETNHLSA